MDNLESSYKKYLVKTCRNTLDLQILKMSQHKKKDRAILLSNKNSIKLKLKNKDNNKVDVIEIIKINSPFIDFKDSHLLNSYNEEDKFDEFILDLYYKKLNHIRHNMSLKLLKDQEAVNFIMGSTDYLFIDKVKIVVGFIF